jgi:hypothetical protein
MAVLLASSSSDVDLEKKNFPFETEKSKTNFDSWLQKCTLQTITPSVQANAPTEQPVSPTFL